MNDASIHKKISAIRSTIAMAVSSLAELERELSNGTPKKKTYKEEFFDRQRRNDLKLKKTA